MNEVDLKADFYTFKNQIIEKFGQFYYDQAEIFFERAHSFAEKGFHYNAISDGKFALSLTNYSNDDSEIYYIIGFISQLYCDVGKTSKAREYHDLGVKMLDSETDSYEDDKAMFDRLLEHINNESWKDENDQKD